MALLEVMYQRIYIYIYMCVCVCVAKNDNLKTRLTY
jgi:hypothetical protein